MQRILKSSALMLVAGILLPASRGADNSPPPIVPVGAPKSEFVDDPGNGKDPFFPRSTRRKAVVKTVDTAPPDPTVPSFVVLRGISLAQGRKLAIINNHTLGEGEERELKAPNGQVLKIRVIEIKEKSVIIETGGFSKEIPLRSTLQ